MRKKYELTSDYIILYRRKLFRIVALIDFANVKAGDLGGYIEKEENLFHVGNCWVADEARVFGEAHITGNAWVCDQSQVSGNAYVSGNAVIGDYAKISDYAQVYDNTWIYGDSVVRDNAHIYGGASVTDTAQICGFANVCDDAFIYGNSLVDCNAWISGNARISGQARITGDAYITGNADVQDTSDYAVFKGFGDEHRTITFFRCGKNSIGVNCSCFRGTLNEFKEFIKHTYSGKVKEEYLRIVDLMEFHFGE